MEEYHSWVPSTTADAAQEAPDQPALVAKGKLRPTRFKANCPAVPKKQLAQSLSIDAKYHKYASTAISSESEPEIDILYFWEVRFFSSKGALMV